MSSARSHVFSAPFDGVADRYDEVFTTSRIGLAQRASVWRELERTFHAGDCVLEIGCGTGVDACFLADRGVHVLACDSSSRMIAITTRRLINHHHAGRVQPQILAAEEIRTLRGAEPFDGVFSNFGALNCVQNIPALAKDLAPLVRPGAAVLLCWMGPCCLWEIFWYLAQAKPAKALRRLHRGGSSALLSGGGYVHVHYPSLHSLARAFSPEFSLESIKGIGVAVPPSYLESAANRFPRLLRTAELVDSFLGRCPGIRILADHVLVKFKRTEARSTMTLPTP